MTRVIHTGDTHLGYRQYHSPERRRDYAAAFRRVVRDAVDEDVDAVIHAGDLFHDRRPDLGDLMTTISILRELDDADIPFLAIVGNHESTRGVTADGDGRDAQWLDLFERLGLATRLDAAGTRVGDAVLYGLDHVPRSKREDLDYEFEQRDAEFAALVSHGLFTPFDGGRWDLEAVLEAANLDFDAVLLGDNHDPGIQQVGGAWATYCGSTEREERGYNVVSFDGEVQISRKGLPTREFAFVDVELHEGEGVGTVLERIRERDVEDAVVVVTLSGDGEPVTPAEVERFGDEQGALVTRVNDRRELATPEADVEVSFADPDEAVRRRVREMGLSEAARRVDRTVRDDAVADSNVRERVDEAVRDLLDDDPGAFERVPEPEDEPGADAEPGEDDGAATGADAEPADVDGTATATADGDGTAAIAEGDGTADDDEVSTDDAGDEAATDDSAAAEDADGQATWEEFV